MSIYAILNKSSNIVKNIAISDGIDFVYVSNDEYVVLANQAVGIGMVYDPKTKTFPEVRDRGELLDLRDEIMLIISSHQEKINENLSCQCPMSPEEYQTHHNYIQRLNSISLLTSYSEMKSQFDSLGPAPEFHPMPKEITQELFRSALNFTEKVLWDNPETGTESQKSIINTIKSDFPYYGLDSMNDEFDALVQVQFTTTQRVVEIKAKLS